MWLVSALFIWSIAMISDGSGATSRMPFLHALVIGACIAPTDPVLSNTIVKGRWADQHVPGPIVLLISSESGANDGLGYPFLCFALYLVKYLGTRGSSGAAGDAWAAGHWGGARSAMGMWFGETWFYVIIMSVVWGGLVGYVSRKALQACKSRGWVHMESTCGMVGSNDILASFVAANALSWDNWFRKQTKNDAFEPTVDFLLNTSIFIWFGVVCPWPSFSSSIVPLWCLPVLAIVIILLRRPIPLLIIYWLLPQVKSVKEALFMGYFGPIGVSAVFYQHFALEFLLTEVLGANGEMREDARILSETLRVIVWFMVMANIVVYGTSIPIYQSSIYIMQRTPLWQATQEEKLRVSDIWQREKQHGWIHRLEDGTMGIEHRMSLPLRRVRTYMEDNDYPDNESS
ncbi:hypothetical protein AJ79_07909 [Helicocarpus griseus UAMH5409]|uniref:Cation/H+ exchanger transmembrane domain-containing protein n=1 Tax=Helicocarpus griseus UAMH5409 TaxID=1447875 RepID=A0A2B7WY75_9EURO|nr:hypothetical protein AJ79_07909 [Helicocarpus griseus UAMH5409]